MSSADDDVLQLVDGMYMEFGEEVAGVFCCEAKGFEGLQVVLVYRAGCA